MLGSGFRVIVLESFVDFVYLFKVRSFNEVFWPLCEQALPEGLTLDARC